MGITSLLSTRVLFFIMNDPEGPNVLILTAMTTIIYFLTIGIYSLKFPFIGLRKLFLVFLIQIVFVIGFYFWLR